jgi:outer membrane receptor protein involved in Fe transport
MYSFKSLSVIFIAFLFSSISILSQSTTGQLRGKIIDSDTGDAVFGATVVVISEKKGTKTDFDGKYQLDLPEGEYVVEYRMFGYDTQKKKVNIAANRNIDLNITFGTKTLDTVEVSDRALNNTDASLLALQKKSGTVSDGISQESIRKSPDSSAGEVAKRVTGITLLGGKYIFVRGLGERYSNTMLDNTMIPSPEPDKRVVPLDIFPSGLLKNIRIIKTFVPEDSGEFSGGLVKIETQEYPDQFTMNLNVGVGRNFQTTGNNFKSFSGGNFLGQSTLDQKLPSTIESLPEPVPFVQGDRFGGGLPPRLTNATQNAFPQQWTPTQKEAPYDKSFSFSVGNTYKINESGSRLGILYGTSYSTNYRFREESSRRYFPGNLISKDFKSTSYLTKMQEQDSKVYNQDILWGNNLNLALELTKDHQLYWKNLYTSNSDKNVREATGINYIDTFEFRANTNTYTSRGLLNSILGGTHALNIADRPHKLSWSFAYAQAKRDEPNVTGEVWSRSLSNNALTTPLYRLGNNPDGSRYYSYSQDDVRTYNLSYEIPFNQWQGLKSILKIGTSHSDRFKYFKFNEFGQKSIEGRTRLDEYPVPGEVLYNSLTFLQGNRTFQERVGEGNAYDAYHKLKAYYAQVDMPLISKLRFIGGARYEDSYQKVETFAQRDAWDPRKRPGYGCNIDNSDLRVLAIDKTYCRKDNFGVGELATKDLLPAANLVYDYKENMNFRFGFSQTVNRPDLRELSPFAFTPYFGANRTSGNSNLDRAYVHNYDLRYEYYLKGSDFIGIGTFYKFISNPIETIGQPVAGQISPFFTFANANQATLKGIEFDYRKDIFNTFRVETNLFFIKSKVDVIDYSTYAFAQAGLLPINSSAFLYNPTNLSRPLQGQSENVFNLKLDYFLTKKKNSTLGLYYNYFGDRIYAVGANGIPDAIEKGVGVTDLVFQYLHLESYNIKIALKNITNTRFRIYQKSELTGRDELFFSYREGVSLTFSAGVKF